MGECVSLRHVASELSVTGAVSSEDPAVRQLRNQAQECYLNFTECVHRLTHNPESPYGMVSSEEMISFFTSDGSGRQLYALPEPLHRNLYGW